MTAPTAEISDVGILINPMLKYTKNPDKYGSQEQILEILSELSPNAAVLDVGTARGYIGMHLSGKGLYLVGIEQDPSSARVAREFYDEFFVSDIEQETPRFTRKFDAIVLADILEHLRDPYPVLMRLREHLSTNGAFIISVPNVANIYVRVNLLFGRFDYADRGILDETHLRFFTLKTIKGLLRRARLRVKRLVVSPIPLPLVFPQTREGAALHVVHRANWAITRMWKRLFAYQFIFVAVPGSESEE